MTLLDWAATKFGLLATAVPLMLLAMTFARQGFAEGPEIRRFEIDAITGGATATAVTAAELIHLNQIMPLGSDGKVVGGDDIREQLGQLSSNLMGAIAAVGGDSSRILKLNVYVAKAEVAQAVRDWFNGLPADTPRPAISFVVTPLPDPAALAAIDAVIAGEGAKGDNDRVVRRVEEAKRFGGRVGPAAVVLPVGPRVYISGQAEKGDGSVADATRQTMASLGRTLEFLGLQRSDVVQVKAFITPMTEVAAFEKEVVAFFGDQPLPVLAAVEWESNLPIEIEMVVAGKAEAEAQVAGAIEYLTPPGMTASPIYCRVAKVLSPTTIYTAGIFVNAGLDGEKEVAEVIHKLGDILRQTGSDFKHLAKATYYVASDATSAELNRQRPQHYDPARPPAASKAAVAGSSREGNQITIDMIGTTKP